MNVNTQELIEAVDRSIEQHEQKSAEKIAEIEQKMRDLETAKLTAMPGLSSRKSVRLGEALAKSESFQALKNRESKSATLTLNHAIKNLVQAGFDSTGDDPYNSQAERDPRLANDPRRPLTLLEALPSLPVSAGTFEYVSLNGYSNAAAEQSAEGVAKAEASLPTELKSTRIATIAHWLRASEQILQDVPQLSQQVSDLMNYGVRSKAESLIVSGSGDIQGLETVGTAFTASTGLTLADAISEASADMAADGWLPSHVILNPADWHAIRSERDDQGAYVAQGWGGLVAPSLWGLSVVESASVSAGTPIVIDSSQLAVLDRMGAIVELFREDSTNVQANLVTVRAEMRLGFACFAPASVRLVSTV
jgi:HK97 family phage major capsid protein